MQIATIEQTCFACPSQWEGRLDDGRPFYIRFRWGVLDIQVGEVGGSLGSALDAKSWFEWASDNDLDGEISLEDVCRLSGLIAPQSQPANS